MPDSNAGPAEKLCIGCLPAGQEMRHCRRLLSQAHLTFLHDEGSAGYLSAVDRALGAWEGALAVKSPEK